jgi:alpha-tubulin suppressor-like RCC1 family protein
VASLVANGRHACTVFEDGSMRCWGDNTYGELGFGDLWSGGYAHITEGIPPIDRVMIGGGHMCALTTDRCVWCWGSNSYGQLGVSELGGSAWPVRITGMTGVVDIAADGFASFALRDDGRVEWWGLRTLDAIAKVPTTWIESSSYTSIDSESQFACGLRSDGMVECWGSNEYGQLGTGDDVYRQQPTAVVGLTDVVRIALGSWTACAVRADKSLWCWGSNAGGQLGDGTTIDEWTPQKVPLDDVEEVALSGHVCARTSLGHVFCWGVNSEKQVGNGATGDVILTPWEIVAVQGARAVAVGSWFTCALLGDHDVRCWGDNLYGQLGTGTWQDSSTPVKVVWEDPP